MSKARQNPIEQKYQKKAKAKVYTKQVQQVCMLPTSKTVQNLKKTILKNLKTS